MAEKTATHFLHSNLSQRLSVSEITTEVELFSASIKYLGLEIDDFQEQNGHHYKQITNQIL